MKRYCPTCGEGYEASIAECSFDGSSLRATDEADDPLVGELIAGCFRTTDIVGEGGMGRVYRAIQRPIGRRVALKILAEHSRDDVSLDRFFREARLASDLTHPNVVRPVDFGEDASFDVVYFAMELVQGTELDALLDAGALELSLALEVVHQVAGALTDAHDKGIIHRDLKPHNLKLVPVSDGSLQIKVLDLGIARPVDDQRDLTQTGHLAGTPWYMAPEYVREGDLDHRADLYALGIILYEMLCGERPFVGNSAQILLQHVQAEPPSLSAHTPPSTSVPEPVDDLYRHLLTKTPERRCESAREIRERIDAIQRRLDLEPIRCDASPSEATREDFEPWLVETTARSSTNERAEAQAPTVCENSESEIDGVDTLSLDHARRHDDGPSTNASPGSADDGTEAPASSPRRCSSSSVVSASPLEDEDESEARDAASSNDVDGTVVPDDTYRPTQPAPSVDEDDERRREQSTDTSMRRSKHADETRSHTTGTIVLALGMLTGVVTLAIVQFGDTLGTTIASAATAPFATSDSDAEVDARSQRRPSLSSDAGVPTVDATSLDTRRADASRTSDDTSSGADPDGRPSFRPDTTTRRAEPETPSTDREPTHPPDPTASSSETHARGTSSAGSASSPSSLETSTDTREASSSDGSPPPTHDPSSSARTPPPTNRLGSNSPPEQGDPTAPEASDRSTSATETNPTSKESNSSLDTLLDDLERP
jgi:serine/threonine-protein kinase